MGQDGEHAALLGGKCRPPRRRGIARPYGNLYESIAKTDPRPVALQPRLPHRVDATKGALGTTTAHRSKKAPGTSVNVWLSKDPDRPAAAGTTGRKRGARSRVEWSRCRTERVALRIRPRPTTGDAQMKAMVLKKFGGPDSFELQDVAVPDVESDELLVRVIATAINPLDYQIRRGDYPEHVPLPAITGHDVSGVVEKVGTGVNDFAVGDEVFYTPRIFGPKG